MEINEAGESRLRHSPTVGIGAGPRRGKAPPVDSFSGDDGDTCFDDWLPSLERAASWNAWTDEEKLLQLAGHLHGRALQEWNLISTEDRMTFVDPVKSLRARVDPENRVLAGQEFRHAIQESDESVPRYIRRLERLFQTAYDRDRLRVETREMLLYSQLQEGLRYTLIKSPAISGADSNTIISIMYIVMYFIGIMVLWTHCHILVFELTKPKNLSISKEEEKFEITTLTPVLQAFLDFLKISLAFNMIST